MASAVHKQSESLQPHYGMLVGRCAICHLDQKVDDRGHLVTHPRGGAAARAYREDEV